MILAKTVYNAYPDAQALDIDPPEEGETLEAYYNRVKDDLFGCGDTLFAFILIELKECLDRPVSALELAVRNLQDIIAALEANGHGEEDDAPQDADCSPSGPG